MRGEEESDGQARRLGRRSDGEGTRVSSREVKEMERGARTALIEAQRLREGGREGKRRE